MKNTLLICLLPASCGVNAQNVDRSKTAGLCLLINHNQGNLVFGEYALQGEYDN